MKILIKVKMFARFRSRLIPMKSKFILSISLGELQLLQLYSHLHQHHEKRPELKCHLRHFKPNSAQPVITSKMFFSSAAWLTMPLTTLNVVLSKAYPMSVSPSIDFLVRWILVTRILVFLVGKPKFFLFISPPRKWKMDVTCLKDDTQKFSAL